MPESPSNGHAKQSRSLSRGSEQLYSITEGGLSARSVSTWYSSGQFLTRASHKDLQGDSVALAECETLFLIAGLLSSCIAFMKSPNHPGAGLKLAVASMYDYYAKASAVLNCRMLRHSCNIHYYMFGLPKVNTPEFSV